MNLHVGGQVAKEGWHVLDVQPGQHVDFVGECTDLSRFADGSIDEIYASHVLEHLDYQRELSTALREFRRVLRPGGRVRISVPNFDLLCRLFTHPELDANQRFHVMRVIFGGQIDAHDYHKVGLTWEFLHYYLSDAGFLDVAHVEEFGEFPDSSALRLWGNLISLNVEARAPAGPPLPTAPPRAE
jgi:predicted SAM-dependent methyltransferase